MVYGNRHHTEGVRPGGRGGASRTERDLFSTLYGDDGKSAQVEVSHEIVNEGTDKASVSLISSLWDAEGKKCWRYLPVRSLPRERKRPLL